MTRKIKNLGLVLVAVVAMSVAAAASAQASELHVTHQGSATLTGQQTTQHVFTTDAGEGTCTTVNSEATVQGQGAQITATELTTTATYSGCIFAGQAAQVKLNGCKYTITNKSAQGVTTAKTAYVDITGCTAGKQIEINAAFGTCVVTVPEQHHLSHIVAADEGTPGTNTEDVGVQVTVTGITYELHGGFCPGGGATGLRHNGTYTGKTTFKAFKDTGIEVGVTQHNHKFDRSKHDDQQVGLRST